MSGGMVPLEKALHSGLLPGPHLSCSKSLCLLPPYHLLMLFYSFGGVQFPSFS